MFHFCLQLNQDILENFFSQLRQIGGVHDHPSPLNCIYVQSAQDSDGLQYVMGYISNKYNTKY